MPLHPWLLKDQLNGHAIGHVKDCVLEIVLIRVQENVLGVMELARIDALTHVWKNAAIPARSLVKIHVQRIVLKFVVTHVPSIVPEAVPVVV